MARHKVICLKNVRGWVLTCLLVLSASGLLAASTKSNLGNTIEAGIAKAQEIAGAQGKLVFLKFGADWCPPCVQMEGETFSDPEVKAFLANHTIPISIEVKSVRKPKGVFQKYDVRGLPTLVFLDKNGNIVDRHLGYLSRSTFLKRGYLAVNGENAIDRALADLDQAGPNSPKQREALADAYRNLMRYSDALQEYEWCVDEGAEYDPDYIAQRSSAFAGLCELGDRYPPAQEAVNDRLATAGDRLTQDSSDLVETLQAASDVVDINRILEKEKNTKKLYRALAKDSSKSVQTHALLAAGLAKSMHEGKRRSGLAVPDLMGAAELLAEEHAQRQRHYAENPQVGDESFKLAIEAMRIRRSVTIYEILLDSGHLAEAAKVAGQLLAEVDGSLAYGKLAAAGLRSGELNARHLQWAWDSVKANPDSLGSVITLAKILAERGQRELGVKMLKDRLQLFGEHEESDLQTALEDLAAN